jgi:hypothetical protein
LQFQLRNQAEDEKNMSKNKSVLGIYSSRIGVENAISVLKDSGFAYTDLSVLLPENLGSKELATEKGTKAPEGATAGAGSGAVVGGMLGWLVGIGALAIPPGAGVGGAMGGVTGALVGSGFLNTKPGDMKGGFRRVESWSPYIAIPPLRSNVPKKLWNALAPRISPLREKPRRTGNQAIRRQQKR